MLEALSGKSKNKVLDCNICNQETLNGERDSVLKWRDVIAGPKKGWDSGTECNDCNTARARNGWNSMKHDVMRCLDAMLIFCGQTILLQGEPDQYIFVSPQNFTEQYWLTSPGKCVNKKCVGYVGNTIQWKKCEKMCMCQEYAMPLSYFKVLSFNAACWSQKKTLSYVAICFHVVTSLLN